MQANQKKHPVHLRGSIPPDRYLLLIGAMKSGTTSLYAYLSSHPRICGARHKEPGYFSQKGYRATNPPSYEDLWDFDLEKHSYAMEGSTSYTKYPNSGNAAENIFMAGLRPKFIYVMRNPFDRIESQYNHMVVRSPQKNTKPVTHPLIVQVSMYYTQVEQYRKFFPAEDILLLDHQQIIDDLPATLDRIGAFLNLEMGGLPAEYPKANSNRVDGRLACQIRKKYGTFWPVRKLWPAIRATSNYFSPYPSRRLTPSERETIRNLLKEDMANLERCYGINVQRWGF